MAIEIKEDLMKTTVNGMIVAVAVRVDGAWQATTWPTPLTYNQSITAMMLAERLATGHDEGDPFVRAWRAELSE